MTREEAIDIIVREEFYNTDASVWEKMPEVKEALDMAIEALKERPHGEWKVDNKIYCSKCGESICDFIPNPTDAVGLILSNNFCPNCGSDNRPRILDEAIDGEGEDGNVKEGE